MVASRLHPAFAGLLPHAPILVPEVGGEPPAGCRASLAACRELARRLCASTPDRLVLVSPHALRRAAALGVYGSAALHGDLRKFGAGHVTVEAQPDCDFTVALRHAAEAADVEIWTLPSHSLDHGAVVPLWFLAEAGWHGPTSVLSPPIVQGPTRLAALGRAVAGAASSLSGRTALVASGDMTHRAEPDGPAGYDPRALEFDQQLIDLLRHGELASIATIDPGLLALAAEDATDTTALVAAAIGNQGHGSEVLAYEHPFGVGYLVAVLHDGRGEAP